MKRLVYHFMILAHIMWYRPAVAWTAYQAIDTGGKRVHTGRHYVIYNVALMTSSQGHLVVRQSFTGHRGVPV